jgi:flagellar biogenesis protein FliO
VGEGLGAKSSGVERVFPLNLGDPSVSVLPLIVNKPAASPAVNNAGGGVSEPVPLGGDTRPSGSAPGAPVTGGKAEDAGRPFENQTIRAQAGNSAPGKSAAPAEGSGKPAGGWGGVGGGWQSLGQMITALAVVVGLIFVGRAAARKFVPGAKASNGKGVIEVLARHPLAKNQMIVLLRIGSQIVALNQGKEASQSVLVISDAQEVARIIGQIEGKSPHSIQAGFNKLLANARMDLEEAPTAGEETDLKAMDPESLDEQLDEMAAAKRQLMELRQHVRSVRDRIAT